MYVVLVTSSPDPGPLSRHPAGTISKDPSGLNDNLRMKAKDFLCDWLSNFIDDLNINDSYNQQVSVTCGYFKFNASEYSQPVCMYMYKSL